MKPVKNAVRNRSKNYTSHQNNRQTAVESIDACKELSSIGDRRINRSHAAQKHRCVEECVNPAQSLEGVVSEHADEQETAIIPIAMIPLWGSLTKNW